MKAKLKIKFNRHSWSKYKEEQCRKALETHAPTILGEENLKKIKSFKIILMKNWRSNNLFRNPNVFEHCYNPKTGEATIILAPNWMYKRSLTSREYGVCHELVHIKDVIEENIISEKPRRGEKIRVWFRHNPEDKHTLYTETVPERVTSKMFEEDYDAFYALMSAYYPWECEALQVRSIYLD